MNTYRKLDADRWGIQCDKEETTGATVTVTTKAGKVKTVTLGERQNLLGFVYAIAEQARPAAVAVGELTGILALFDRAAKRLKFPAIELAVPVEWNERIAFRAKNPAIELHEKYDASGKPIAAYFLTRLNVAGSRASVPGSITLVTSERRMEDDRRGWLGRILRDGTYQPSREAPADLAQHLRVFALAPAEIASATGRLVGRCCFCRLPLSDARSTAVGYGEICASNYGLPWGDERTTFAA